MPQHLNTGSDHEPAISIVIPVYHGRDCLEALYERLQMTLTSVISSNFEIIFVDDRSPGDDWQAIQAIANRDARVKGIQLSRNFGQYPALTAGLDHARSAWIVIMDCDLQDVPEEIPKLYAKAQEGYDIVLAQRVERHDNWLKKCTSRAFYAVFSYLTETRQDPTTAQFGIYHRRVIQALLSMRERLRFIPAFIGWIGFRATAIPVLHARAEREGARSGYSFKRLLNLAVDTILAFSDKPLRLSIKLGFSIAILSLLVAICIVIRALAGIQEPVGWASLMVSISFFSGLIILMGGINGLYIARIFDEVKGRPLYIINQIYTKTPG